MKSITFLVLLLLSHSAFSDVVWDWQIDNPNVIVQLNENVVFYATIFNGESSETLSELDINLPEEVVDLTFLVSPLDPNLFNEYTFDIGEAGAGTIRSQFAGVVLEPGQSHQFVIYTLAPTDGAVAPGSYSMGINSLLLTASSQGSIDFGATNITVVPIPSAFLLFFSALLPVFSKTKLTRLGYGSKNLRLFSATNGVTSHCL